MSSWRRPQLTLRLRLTLLYGLLFLGAGLLLVLVSYTLLRESLEERLEPFPSVVAGTPLSPGVQVPLDEALGQPQSSLSSEPMQSMPIDAITVDGQPLDEAIREFEEDVRRDALNELLVQSSFALGMTATIAMLLGWIVAGRVVEPVRAITMAARRAADSDLHARVNLDGPHDELKELADTFDHMLSRLEVAFESQRRFAAQASHELRTPFAITRAESDVTLADPAATERERRLANVVQSAALRGERMIDSLLVLARSQSSMLDRAQVDWAEVTGDVAGELIRRADEAEVTLDVTLGNALVTGDRMLLDRLVGNLIENAIRHNTRGGWVRVDIATNAGQAYLRVVNSGPVVSPEQVASMFEPFQRRATGEQAGAPGTGLGLTIVRSIIVSHGGTIAMTARPDGGLEIVVTLPQSQCSALASASLPPTEPVVAAR